MEFCSLENNDTVTVICRYPTTVLLNHECSADGNNLYRLESFETAMMTLSMTLCLYVVTFGVRFDQALLRKDVFGPYAYISRKCISRVSIKPHVHFGHRVKRFEDVLSDCTAVVICNRHMMLCHSVYYRPHCD